MSVLLEVKNLTIRRESRMVLEVDDLSVEESQVLAVIGPNGAGKSTLLLALSRLLAHDQGQVTFRGQPIEEMDELTYRRRIGLVLQEPLLLDGSVFENVAMGLRFRRMPRTEVSQRVDEWLKRLNISHLRDRSVRKLSGGEAQRVSLARAFALQPEVLMLDEPFSALDAPTRSRLLEDFQALLAATSITTLFITHDLDEALYLADQVAVLLEGRLRQSGSIQQVFSAPADPDVATFVGVETVIAGRVVASSEERLIVQINGLRLEAVGELAVGREVMFCLRPEDVTLWLEEIPPPSSARNRLSGRIVRMTPQGPLARIVLDCGFPLVALITRASAQEMGLGEGQLATAAFKASVVHLIPR
jgi:tungstate transport system ATP-binding protein